MAKPARFDWTRYRATQRAKGFDVRVELQVSDEMKQELQGLARKKKTSVAELIRTYIEWGFENDEH